MALNIPAYETLATTLKDDTLVVTLNRPQMRNAMNLAMCQDLQDLFQTLAGGNAVRAVIIRGAGPAFCSGLDTKEFGTMSADEKAVRRSAGLDTYLAITHSAMPVVAAVHGALVGAGCELMLACDFAIAAEDATFRWPEALVGAVGATQRLPRIVGLPVACDLLFTGRRIDAARALELNIITRVVSPDNFEQEIEQLQAELSVATPAALRFMKQSIHQGNQLPVDEGVELERRIIEQSIKQEGGRG